MKYPTYISRLVDVFKKLPGVGHRSAHRYVFEMSTWPQQQLLHFAQLLKTFAENLKKCDECGGLIEDQCSFCHNPHRNQHTLCLVAHAKDIFTIENTKSYKGLYHVLGGTISPLSGIGPQQLRFDTLFQRIGKLQIKEIIVALDSTIEGDATALYLKEQLNQSSIHVSRLALGLPMGSSLEGIDGGTLAQALNGRREF